MLEDVLRGPLPRGSISPGSVSEQDMRDIRGQSIAAATYVSPEMGAFGDEDAVYLERFFKTAQRIADWIVDGV